MNLSNNAFELVHMGIWGPYKVAIHDGHRYFLTIGDGYSRMTWIFPLKLKSDIVVVLI